MEENKHRYTEIERIQSNDNIDELFFIYLF